MRRCLPAFLVGFVFVGLPGAVGCGRTTDAYDGGESSSGSSGGTSESSTSTESSSTESSSETSGGDTANFLPDDTSSSESGIAPLTCREIIECLLGCLADGGGLDCLSTCSQGADPEAGAAAGALLYCIGEVCVTEGECILPDFTSPDCVACIGFGLFLPEPPGCEAEAMACQ